MTSTAIEQTTSPTKLGSLPTHVIWANDESSDRFIVNKPEKQSRYYNQARASSSYSDTTATRSNSTPNERPSSNSIVDPAQRAFRLERNLRFLKIQHQKMLNELFMEIETLRSRNRELQFKHAFGLPLIEYTEPEEQNQNTTAVTIKEFNSTETQTESRSSSLRLQHLEEELHRLRMALEDAETRNSCLNSLVTQLKKNHIKLKSAEGNATINNLISNPSNMQLQSSDKVSNTAVKIEEYEKLIRMLRKENIDQKKELIHIRSSLANYLKSNGKEVSDESDKQPSKLPRIPLPRETPKVHHENKNSIELPPIHPKSHRSFSSKGNTALFTQEVYEQKKEASNSIGDDDHPARTNSKTSSTKSEFKYF